MPRMWKKGEVGMTVPELNVLKATRITAKDMPISMNAASERLHDLAIEWEEHNERFEDINPFFVAMREVRDKNIEWKAQEPTIPHMVDWGIYECPKCKTRVDKTYKYCKCCGQAVKWND